MKSSARNQPLVHFDYNSAQLCKCDDTTMISHRRSFHPFRWGSLRLRNRKRWLRKTARNRPQQNREADIDGRTTCDLFRFDKTLRRSCYFPAEHSLRLIYCLDNLHFRNNNGGLQLYFRCYVKPALRKINTLQTMCAFWFIRWGIWNRKSVSSNLT